MEQNIYLNNKKARKQEQTMKFKGMKPKVEGLDKAMEVLVMQ